MMDRLMFSIHCERSWLKVVKFSAHGHLIVHDCTLFDTAVQSYMTPPGLQPGHGRRGRSDASTGEPAMVDRVRDFEHKITARDFEHKITARGLAAAPRSQSQRGQEAADSGRGDDSLLAPWMAQLDVAHKTALWQLMAFTPPHYESLSSLDTVPAESVVDRSAL